MYEMSHCVSLFSRCYFEIFMGGDVFAGDSFHLETFRIPMKGFFSPSVYLLFFIFLEIKQFLLGSIFVNEA